MIQNYTIQYLKPPKVSYHSNLVDMEYRHHSLFKQSTILNCVTNKTGRPQNAKQ